MLLSQFPTFNIHTSVHRCLIITSKFLDRMPVCFLSAIGMAEIPSPAQGDFTSSDRKLDLDQFDIHTEESFCPMSVNFTPSVKINPSLMMTRGWKIFISGPSAASLRISLSVTFHLFNTRAMWVLCTARLKNTNDQLSFKHKTNLLSHVFVCFLKSFYRGNEGVWAIS